MKDSNSIFQITILKAIIVIYFLYIISNSLNSNVSFFHDNAEFGFWTIISFFMISGFILFVDIAIISLVAKIFKDKNKRVYILIFQSIICVIVYFALNYMFQNADKWNEYANNEKQTLQTESTNKQLHDIKGIWFLNKWTIYHTLEFSDTTLFVDNNIDSFFYSNYSLYNDTLILRDNDSIVTYKEKIITLTQDTLIIKNFGNNKIF